MGLAFIGISVRSALEGAVANRPTDLVRWTTRVGAATNWAANAAHPAEQDVNGPMDYQDGPECGRGPQPADVALLRALGPLTI